MTAIVTVDLGFGDAGKGSIVDYLSRPGAGVAGVVRYNGGPQAAHRVVQTDGREHVFSQFGSGTFHPGVRTLLGPGMLVNPLNLMLEREYLAAAGVPDAMRRLAIDARCVLVTPFHIAANRIRESLLGDARHGSCGQGVGEARRLELDGLAVRAADVLEPALALRRLAEVQARLRDDILPLISAAPDIPDVARNEWRFLKDFASCAWLADRYGKIIGDHLVRGDLHLRLLLEQGDVVFEGAQGVLLDQTHGFHPYTTWTDTTTGPAFDLLADAGYDGDGRVLGIVRAYQTRHGPGPFPTEDAYLTAALPDAENGADDWQGPFRVGWLDATLLEYALRATSGGVDGLAMTCVDRLEGMTVGPYLARPGRALPGDPDDGDETVVLDRVLLDDLPARLEAAVGEPVVLVSRGPTLADKMERLPAWSAA